MDENGFFQASTALPPWKERPVAIEEGAGWAPGPVWSFWGREKFLPPVGNRTTVPRLAVCSVVYSDYATSSRVCVCVCIYTYTHNHKYIHIYICLSVHTHTHTQTYKHRLYVFILHFVDRASCYDSW
jgi:hypothetical protein